MAQNNSNIIQHHNSVGSVASSYDQFFAGNVWSRSSQSPNPNSSLVRPPSAANMPSTSSALHQTWDQHTPLSNSPLDHSANQHSQFSTPNMAVFQQPNRYAAADQPSVSAQHPVSHYPSLSHIQPSPASRPQTTSTSPISHSHSHTQQAASSKASAHASCHQQIAAKQQPVVYVPYLRPAHSADNQYNAQPTMTVQYQYPQYPSGYGNPLHHMSSIQQSTPHSISQSALAPGGQSHGKTSLLAQVQQVLSGTTPPAEPIPSNPRFAIVNSQMLCESTNSRMANSLLAISNSPIELSHGKVPQVPSFLPRKNLHELRKFTAQDAELKARIDKLDRKRRSRLISSANFDSRQLGNGPLTRESPVSSSDDETTDESDESDDDLEIEEKSPLPASRPTDPVKGAEYDVIKAVWHSKSKYLEDDILRSRMSQFSEQFFKLRDRWKGSNDALKAADAESSNEIASLTSQVKRNRSILGVALKAATVHGHPHILSMLSRNKRLVAGIYGILLDRLREKADDPLIAITVNFLDQLTGLTTDTLEVTKVLNGLVAIIKKGTEDTKLIAKRIIDRSAENTKRPTNDSATSQDSSNASGNVEAATAKANINGKPANAITPKTNTSVVESTNSKVSNSTASTLKRPRSVDAASTQPQPIKKQATSSQAVKATVPATPVPAKKPITTIGSKSTATSSVKPKQAIVPVRAAPLAVGTAKKVATLNTKTTPATRTMGAKSSGFSFGGMMQNILKQDVEETKEKPVEAAPTESSEEKSKRVRKEMRRRLRVSWKPDHELCAIKVFDHDPEEETGHDASSVRDVNDVGNEGRMFKKLHKDHQEIIDIDMEEEEKEEVFFDNDWEPPVEIDFTDLDEDWSKIYKPYGAGELEPDSPEKAVQQQRETAILMTVYITRDDIPSRPQSPSEVLEEPVVPPVDFGPPDEMTKHRIAALLPPVAGNVDMDAIARILAGNTQTTSETVQQAVQAPTQAQIPAPSINPITPMPSDVLASLLSQTQNLPSDTNTNHFINRNTAPEPGPLVDHSPFTGLHGVAQIPNTCSAAGVPPTIDISAILSTLGSLNQGAQIMPANQPGQTVSQMGPDVASLMALLAAQSSQTPSPFPAYPFNGQSAPMPQLDAYQGSAVYENPDRKRFRETSDEDLHDNQWSKRANNGQAFKKWETDRKPKWTFDDNPKKFSQPCKFWPIGKCSKGEKCTYRHDV